MTAIKSHVPYLRKTATSKQLIVNGKPYLMLAAELQNSSLTSAEYMEEVWPKLKEGNINTALGCVTWEDIEPTEGAFDFEELDKIIQCARKYDIHLVLLWFGSFKNGVSSYAPSWVKTNPKRFPRVKLRKAGGVLETSDTLSLFCPETRNADARAFSKLLAHLKEIDEGYHTVPMVQVENEVGLLGDSRDGNTLANEAFADAVPKALLDFLTNDWENLHPDLKANLKTFAAKSKPQGSWEDVFGRSPKTDELFMAYHYAQWVDYVAAAGKKEYEAIMYVNVWLNYVGEDSDNAFPSIAGGGGHPGDYPSGGATSNVLDIWQKFAPHLDFISPDVYLTDYSSSCAKYRHRNQPLFIPEQRRDAYGARRAFIAYGSYQALGTSPFGIDTIDPATHAYKKVYGLLDSVSQILLEAQTKPGSSVGFCFDEAPEKGLPDPSKPVVKRFGDYEITIERSFVFGKPSPGAGIVVHQGGAKFLLIGWGFQVRARSVSPTAAYTGILKFKEKVVKDKAKGELKTLRVLNGDETRGGRFAIMPSEDPDYGGFPISVTIPARTMIAELEFYSLEEKEV